MLIALLLFLGECVGHLALLVFGLNWLYGKPLPQRFLKVMRLANWSMVAAGPLGFWLAFGLDLPDAWLNTSEPVSGILGVYGLFSAFVGLVVFPLVTVRRLMRRPPAALLSNHTQIRDVAAELGFQPIGRGKHPGLARLPGNQLFQVEFTERTLRLEDLPAAWDGLSILHLSDLHFHGTPDRVFFDRVMDHCRNWTPDLVAVTGDIVDSSRHHRWIVPVLGRLRWQVSGFAILGNHDSWRDPPVIRRRLRRLGFEVLDNRWVKLMVRGQPLVVIGHEGPWFAPAPDLVSCPDDAFRLCLSHTPDNLPWARRNSVQLMLAGHNHGGQIRFPVAGSVYSPSIFGRHYDCGTFHEPPTLLHVSRGLSGQHPVRYNCRPEVTKLILRRDG